MGAKNLQNPTLMGTFRACKTPSLWVQLKIDTQHIYRPLNIMQISNRFSIHVFVMKNQVYYFRFPHLNH